MMMIIINLFPDKRQWSLGSLCLQSSSLESPATRPSILLGDNADDYDHDHDYDYDDNHYDDDDDEDADDDYDDYDNNESGGEWTQPSQLRSTTSIMSGLSRERFV